METANEIERLKQALMLATAKSSETIAKTDFIANEFSAIVDKIKKMEMLLEEGNGLSNTNNSQNTSIELDNKMIMLKVKEVILEDQELKETFEKMYRNTIEYLERKKNVDQAISSKIETKKNKNKISTKTIFISSIAAIVLIVGTFFYFQKQPTFLLTHEMTFYSPNNPQDGYTLPKTMPNKQVEVIQKQNGKIFFTIDGEKYFVKMKK